MQGTACEHAVPVPVGETHQSRAASADDGMTKKSRASKQPPLSILLMRRSYSHGADPAPVGPGGEDFTAQFRLATRIHAPMRRLNHPVYRNRSLQMVADAL